MFTLHQCGYRFVHQRGISIDRPQGAPFYVFVYYRTPCLLAGAGGQVQAQGRWALWAPGMPHRYHSAATPYVNDWAHFAADADGKALIEDLHIPLGQLMEPDGSLGSARALEALQALDDIPERWQPAVANAQLTALLCALAGPWPAAGRGGAAGRYQAPLAALRAELYSLPTAGTSVQALAGRVGLSASRFQHLYRELFGRTVGEDIIQGRLRRACYLLENTTLPVAAVAEGSGYAEETHFIRQFRQRMGATPGQYRRAAGAAKRGGPG